MLNPKNIAVASLLLAAGLPAAAQTPKISGLGQLWYSQPLDSNLRYNQPTGHTDYYYLNGRYRESAFFFRRAEIKAAAAITENVDYEIMIDPITAGSGRPASDILQDFLIKYKLPANIEFRVGQFKTLQTLEGQTSSSELIFAERSMLAVRFGDVRERGLVGSIGFGNPKAFNGRFHLGFFNGTSGGSGTLKDNDANPQKDIAARLEMGVGSAHHFGAYMLQGITSATPGNQTTVASWADGPTREQVLDNMDSTSNIGAFYRFQTKAFHASAECITGVLGRRYPSIGVTTSARQHLDQAFMGYVGTFAYTFDRHTWAVRYDNMNWNSGQHWYITKDPYVSEAGDYTPNYTEITVGYTFAFKPDRARAANIKLNYINRSPNFQGPRITGYDQTTGEAIRQKGEQGGDSIVVAFQVSF